MREHLVYFLRDEQEILYIGVTIRGIDRVKDHAYQKKIPFTTFCAYAFSNEVDAKTFELKMIAFCRPKYNKFVCEPCYVGVGELKRYIKRMHSVYHGQKEEHPRLSCDKEGQFFKFYFFSMLIGFFPQWLDAVKRGVYVRKWEKLI